MADSNEEYFCKILNATTVQTDLTHLVNCPRDTRFIFEQCGPFRRMEFMI